MHRHLTITYRYINIYIYIQYVHVVRTYCTYCCTDRLCGLVRVATTSAASVSANQWTLPDGTNGRNRVQCCLRGGLVFPNIERFTAVLNTCGVFRCNKSVVFALQMRRGRARSRFAQTQKLKESRLQTEHRMKAERFIDNIFYILYTKQTFWRTRIITFM